MSQGLADSIGNFYNKNDLVCSTNKWQEQKKKKKKNLSERFSSH